MLQDKIQINDTINSVDLLVWFFINLINITERVTIKIAINKGELRNDLIKINSEIMKISSISTSPDTNTLTVVRGYHNTTATTHATDVTSLTKLGAKSVQIWTSLIYEGEKEEC